MRLEEAGAVESVVFVLPSTSAGDVVLAVLQEAVEVQVEAPLAMVQLAGETLSEPVGVDCAAVVTEMLDWAVPAAFETVYVMMAVQPEFAELAVSVCEPLAELALHAPEVPALLQEPLIVYDELQEVPPVELQVFVFDCPGVSVSLDMPSMRSEAVGGVMQELPFQEVPEAQEAETVLVSYTLLPLCSCRLNTV